MKMTFMGILLSVLLMACDINIGSNDSPPADQANSPPVIDTSTDTLEADELARVDLIFGAVTDSDGQIVSYQWQQVDIDPNHTSVTLHNAQELVAYFYAPQIEGSHTWLYFTLTVTDDDGATTTSEPLRVLVQPVETAPHANAGLDQNVDFASFVQLDASASSDDDGTITHYHWEQIQGPSVVLSDVASANTSFTSPSEESLLGFTLTVTDNHGNQDTDMIQIHVVGERLNPQVRRYANPGRLALRWNTAKASDQYNLYYAKGQPVDSSNYLDDPNAIAVLDVSPPFEIPATFNEYQNVYFTLEAVVGTLVVARETTNTVLKDIALDAERPFNRGGCLIEGEQILCWGDSDSENEQVPKLIHPRKVAISNGQACALDDEGMTCWGLEAERTLPSHYSLTAATDLHLEYNRVCVLDNGQRVCWQNEYASALPELSDYSNAQQLVGRCVLAENNMVCSHGASELQAMPNIETAITDADIQYIAGEFDGGCALHGGAVSCWGNKPYVQNLPDLDNPSQVRVGYDHACAQDNGTVVCWGYEDAEATMTPDIDNVTAISVGSFQSCAINDVGLTCWGKDHTNIFEDTQAFHRIVLKQGTLCGLANSKLVCDTPFRHGQPQDYVDVVDVAATRQHSLLACVINGTDVDCWSTLNQPWLTPSPTLNNPRLVSVGGFYSGGDSRFACAVDDSGVQCWGDAYPATLTPPVLENITTIESSTQYSCIANATNMACWGIGEYPNAIDVPAFSHFKDFSINNTERDSNLCAIDGNDIICWNNTRDQQNDVPELNNPSQISVGAEHSCALDSHGVSCWESAAYAGQTQVPTLFNPIQVEAGAYRSCALDDHGLICWGLGNFNGFGWRANPRY